MRRTFTKQDSQSVKGIAILLMLVHHLFYSAKSSHGLLVVYWPLYEGQMIAFARFCKICVPAFVFVTAYGMARKYQTAGPGKRVQSRLTIYRYASLMVSFLFVYVLALLFCQIGGIRTWTEVYGTGLKSGCYALADMLGLTYFTGTPTLNPTWWYMSVAVMLIFALPLLWRLTEKTGFIPIPVLAAGMVLGGSETNQALLAILTALVGVWCARTDLFARLEAVFRKDRIRGIAGIALYAALLAAAFLLRLRFGSRSWILVYPVSAFALAGLVCRGMGSSIPEKLLQFVGRHSMYMFLTHTFLKSYYLHDMIYGFRYPVLIFTVLLLLSLGLSAGLGALEQKFRKHWGIDTMLAGLLG